MLLMRLCKGKDNDCFRVKNKKSISVFATDFSYDYKFRRLRGELDKEIYPKLTTTQYVGIIKSYFKKIRQRFLDEPKFIFNFPYRLGQLKIVGTTTSITAKSENSRSNTDMRNLHTNDIAYKVFWDKSNADFRNKDIRKRRLSKIFKAELKERIFKGANDIDTPVFDAYYPQTEKFVQERMRRNQEHIEAVKKELRNQKH